MREIELKLKIDSREAAVRALVSKQCVLSNPVQQDDYIFLANDPDQKKRFDRAVLRLRQAKGKILFTLKKSITTELDCLECEVEVADFQRARELIEALDYSLWVEVHKERQTCKMGAITVCLDSVEGLGDFIELEKLTADNADYSQVESELQTALHDLGITGERVLYGFDTLVAQQKEL